MQMLVSEAVSLCQSLSVPYKIFSTKVVFYFPHNKITAYTSHKGFSRSTVPTSVQQYLQRLQRNQPSPAPTPIPTPPPSPPTAPVKIVPFHPSLVPPAPELSPLERLLSALSTLRST